MIRIRQAEQDDAQGIAEVHVASWRATYQGIVPDEYLARLSAEQRTRYWTETLAEGTEIIYVAVVEAGESEHIVGFASGGGQRDGDVSTYDGELYAVYSLREYHGQGIGQRLVRTVAEQLAQAGFNSMLVWVLADNPSRGFYERLGGQFVREKAIDIGGTTLTEAAYGWPDIRVLLERQ